MGRQHRERDIDSPRGVLMAINPKNAGLQRVGDGSTHLLPTLPTRQQQHLIGASAEIRSLPESTEVAYLARHLVLATLPHSDPGQVISWRRVSGNSTFLLQPGVDADTGESVGIPYGTIPRLLLYWVVTEVVRTKSPVLHLGNNLAIFMRDLGLDPSRGGKRSDAYRLREQANRLFSASIHFHNKVHDGVLVKKEKGSMQVTRTSDLWWDPRDPNAPTLFKSRVELGQDFYESIITAPIPLDVRALKALRKSPLALDVYALCCYLAFVAGKRGEEQPITWVGLHTQLGADYADVKNFRKKCVASLRKIEAVMPSLKLRLQTGGFTVLPSSRPAINPQRGL